MISHHNFVSLKELSPHLLIQADYARPHNFTGQIVPGYKAVKALLPAPVAEALLKAESLAFSRGLGLKIFDAYRPVKAVEFFQEWALLEESNMAIKEKFYPDFTRHQLFEKGFIARQSIHSQGMAIDLTLYDLDTKNELDMGTIFDFFGDRSYTNSSDLFPNQRENRRLLVEIMESQKFKNYHMEWWHFTYLGIPLPNHYFDFDIT